MNDIIELRDKSGCSLSMCKDAIEYCKGRKDVTPLGYLKAKCIAVKSNKPFYERVKFYSKGEM